MKKFKVMQGVCLLLSVLLIATIVMRYKLLSSYNDYDSIDQKNEVKLALELLIIIGGVLILYTLVYSFFYIRSLLGKQAYIFHRINVYFAGLISLFTLILFILYRESTLSFFLESLSLPFLFVCFTSFKYNRYHAKRLKESNLNSY